MTNLEKLKEVFPYNWSKFVATVGWMCEEYDPQKIRKTNLNVFEEVFGDVKEDQVIAPRGFWEKDYYIKERNN